MSKYMTPKEIADELKVTRGTVYHWIDAGRLQAVRLGGAVRVLRASYDAFVQQATTSQEAR